MDILQISALTWIVASILSAFVIAIDIVMGNRQHMAVMNFVYPLTALYAGPVACIIYFKIGRNKAGNHTHMYTPTWQKVVLGTLHCGAGCTLGDIVAETFLIFVTVKIAGSTLAAKWLLDYILAFSFGILFQYYSIKPMKHLSAGEAFIGALKADSLSLTCWQLGMYGFMALCVFVIFKHQLQASTIPFWFMMQVAMFFGFFTSFPVNWWLIRKGIKTM